MSFKHKYAKFSIKYANFDVKFHKTLPSEKRKAYLETLLDQNQSG